MALKDIVIGLCAVVTIISVILTFTFDLYSPTNLNVNLSEDPDTNVLYTLQDNNNIARSKTEETTLKLYNKTVGQDGMELVTGSTTEDSMIRTSWSALTNLGSYLDVFVDMISIMFVSVGLGTENPVFSFIIFALIITIAVYMISSVFPGWGSN